MKIVLPRLAVSVLAWRLACGVVASAQAGQGSTIACPDITSDRMEVTSNGWFRATGKVSFRYVDHDLRADQVDFNNKTGHVNARGHVELFRQAQGRWVGDSLDYNYITKEGLSGLSDSKSGILTTTAKEKEPKAAVLSKTDALLFEATCKAMAESFAKDDVDGFLKLCIPRDLLPKVLSPKQLERGSETLHKVLFDGNAKRFKELRNRFQDMHEFAFSSAEVGCRMEQSEMYADLNLVLKNSYLTIAYADHIIVRIKIEDMVLIGGKYYVIQL